MQPRKRNRTDLRYHSMIAVMTMNVGYFLSVLGGHFLGTFIAGRLGPSADCC
jgi:hypothetical protein